MIPGPFRLTLLALHGGAVLATHLVAGAALGAMAALLALRALRRGGDRPG